MKFVHTFWSKPFLNSYFNKYQTLLPVILSDYAYSVACIKEFGHEIKLYTDKFGADMLGYIPYDEIVILDDLENENVNFAAQIKFKALERMTLDEILIDGDLFIQNQYGFNHIDSLECDAVYSFDEGEKFTTRDKTMKKKYRILNNRLIEYNDKFDSTYFVNEEEKLNWHNTSLLKFNNEELKAEYIRQYWKNKSIIENENFPIWPDIWIEQKNLTYLTEREPYTCCPVVYGFPEEACNMYSLLIGFTHLGNSKVMYNDVIMNKLKNLNYTLYEKTLNQIEKYKNLKDNE